MSAPRNAPLEALADVLAPPAANPFDSTTLSINDLKRWRQEQLTLDGMMNTMAEKIERRDKIVSSVLEEIKQKTESFTDAPLSRLLFFARANQQEDRDEIIGKLHELNRLKTFHEQKLDLLEMKILQSKMPGKPKMTKEEEELFFKGIDEERTKLTEEHSKKIAGKINQLVNQRKINVVRKIIASWPMEAKETLNDSKDVTELKKHLHDLSNFTATNTLEPTLNKIDNIINNMHTKYIVTIKRAKTKLKNEIKKHLELDAENEIKILREFEKDPASAQRIVRQLISLKNETEEIKKEKEKLLMMKTMKPIYDAMLALNPDEPTEAKLFQTMDMLKNELHARLTKIMQKNRLAATHELGLSRDPEGRDIVSLINATKKMADSVLSDQDQAAKLAAVNQYERSVRDLPSFPHSKWRAIGKAVGCVILAAIGAVLGAVIGAAIEGALMAAMSAPAYGIAGVFGAIKGAVSGSITGWAVGLLVASGLGLGTAATLAVRNINIKENVSKVHDAADEVARKPGRR